LIGRLSVFAGGWTLEAAEAICGKAVDSGQRIVDGSGKGYDADQDLSVGVELTSIRHPPSTDVLELLGALEEKSLVVVELRDGAVRYRMLETVREYGREQLAASGELAEVCKRHRDWYLQLAEQAEAVAGRGGQTERLTRLEADLDNVRAALASCQEEA